ncbi:XrtA/PEP-CTERM system exopolysaccharide export protein [Porticoccus sp. GXU_MW_L64]
MTLFCIGKYKAAFFHLLVVGSMIALAGCNNVREASPEINDLVRPVVEEYKIGVGDQLQVDVWRSPELSAAVTVLPDGKVSTPLASNIQAAGLTTEQLANNITKALDVVLKNPKVTVIVNNADSTDFQRRVRITGAVNSPQSIPYRDGMTVLDLVLLAGGPNDFASLRKAKLYRNTSEGVKVYDINLDSLLNKGKTDENYPLQPSDQITIPERRF